MHFKYRLHKISIIYSGYSFTRLSKDGPKESISRRHFKCTKQVSEIVSHGNTAGDKTKKLINFQFQPIPKINSRKLYI